MPTERRKSANGLKDHFPKGIRLNRLLFEHQSESSASISTCSWMIHDDNMICDGIRGAANIPSSMKIPAEETVLERTIVISPDIVVEERGGSGGAW
jgi:hypothetical protein